MVEDLLEFSHFDLNVASVSEKAFGNSFGYIVSCVNKIL